MIGQEWGGFRDSGYETQGNEDLRYCVGTREGSQDSTQVVEPGRPTIVSAYASNADGRPTLCRLSFTTDARGLYQCCGPPG